MAQILLEMQNLENPSESEVDSTEKLRLMFEETSEFLFPVMKRNIEHIRLSTKPAFLWEEEIKEYMNYTLVNKKHFERATFLGLGIVSVGGNWEDYINVLVGEEFLYISQMILDDIVDDQQRRMNQPTLNCKIGNKKAMTVAEIFSSEGYRLIQNDISNLEPEKQKVIMSSTFEMMKTIYYSQYIDIDLETKNLKDASVEEFMHFLENTTPVDIGNCFKIGSIIGNADDEISEMFYKFGHVIGTMMQIRDDFIDYIEEKRSNKSSFTDIKGNKKRLPIIFAYTNNIASHQKKFLNRILGKQNLNHYEIETLRKILLNEKVLCRGRELIDRLKFEAAQILNNLEIIPKYKKILEEIGNGLNL